MGPGMRLRQKAYKDPRTLVRGGPHVELQAMLPPPQRGKSALVMRLEDCRHRNELLRRS